MRYVMKQKPFAWGDDFTIKPEDGQEAFFVAGRAFSLGTKLSGTAVIDRVCDSERKE